MDTTFITKQLQQQLERINRLIENGSDQDTIEPEYTRALQLLAQKYQPAMAAVSSAEHIRLQQRYKDQVIGLAIAIDWRIAKHNHS